ncbi:hypothetical protein [Pseudomonas sp. MWU12-2345]|uniref:hypothetical protein n=1 Tax=Pseudomonas sp. MWU12-2345 TaxID=2928689 RepID=UPI00200CAAE6|nr:hypothetical protein [Pseudomonas sp. MWU12-2345]
MSRFCFCNCPAGFSADPERHAPDCPGRSGAGKARTPVPATTPALKVSAAEELDAVLHWRGKHTQAIRERDALQQRLTAADERNDTAIDILLRTRAVIEGLGYADLDRDVAAFLKPAEVERNHEIAGTSGMRLNMLANQGE